MKIINLNTYSFYLRLINILLVTLLCSIMMIIIYSLNKGFDFTDEGYFLLSYKHVSIYRGGVHNFHIIITRLSDWLNPGVVEYRWMSLILTIFSSFVLAAGLYRWINATYNKPIIYKDFLFIFCFISIGNFLYYSPGLQTIHYNTLINFFLQVATGLILYLLSCDSFQLIKLKKNLFMMAVIGFICSFCFFTKFSTGILQLTLYILIFCLYLRNHKTKNIFMVVLIICCGSVMGFLTYFTFFQGFHEWTANFKKEFVMFSDHSPVLLLFNYFKDILLSIRFISLYFSWLIIIPLYILAAPNLPAYFRHKNNKHIIHCALFIFLTFFIYEIIHFKFYRSILADNEMGICFYIIIILFQILLLFSIWLSRRIDFIQSLKTNFNKVLVIFLLFITPFVGAFGTANSIFLNTLIHLAPWFGVIIILMIYLSEYFKNQIISSLLIAIISLGTTAQIIDGNTFVPYHSLVMRNKSDLFQQTEKIYDIPQLDGIYVDMNTKIFLSELKQLLKSNHLKYDYPVWGYEISGVIYLLGGISPAVPIYYYDERDHRSFEYFRLNNNPPVIMITDRIPISNKILEIMHDKGINFPQDYSLRGEVYYPIMNAMLKVYFPKSYH